MAQENQNPKPVFPWDNKNIKKAVLETSVEEPKKKTKTRSRIETGVGVPWSEFEPYFNHLRDKTGESQEKCCQMIGYAGGTHIISWKKNNIVPRVAIYAVRFVLEELIAQELHADDDDASPEQKAKLEFSVDELADIFSVIRNSSLSDEYRKALLRKLALFMAES
jgi:hypothetical protein